MKEHGGGGEGRGRGTKGVGYKGKRGGIERIGILREEG